LSFRLSLNVEATPLDHDATLDSEHHVGDEAGIPVPKQSIRISFDIGDVTPTATALQPGCRVATRHSLEVYRIDRSPHRWFTALSAHHSASILASGRKIALWRLPRPLQ
jgi:hypothetical protein